MGAKKLAKKAPKAETTTPMEPTSAVADMVTKNRQSLAMLTASIAVASAASEWNIAKQYETNIWNPLFTMTLNFLITVILALAVVRLRFHAVHCRSSTPHTLHTLQRTQAPSHSSIHSILSCRVYLLRVNHYDLALLLPRSQRIV